MSSTDSSGNITFSSSDFNYTSPLASSSGQTVVGSGGTGKGSGGGGGGTTTSQISGGTTGVYQNGKLVAVEDALAQQSRLPTAGEKLLYGKTIQSQLSSGGGSGNSGSGGGVSTISQTIGGTSVGFTPSGFQSASPAVPSGVTIQSQLSPTTLSPVTSQSTISETPYQRAERFRGFDFNKEDFIARAEGGGFSTPGSIPKSLFTVSEFIGAQLRLDKLQGTFLTKEVSGQKATKIGSDIVTFGFFTPTFSTSAEIAKTITPANVKIIGGQTSVNENVAQTNVLFQATKGKKYEEGAVVVFSRVGKSLTGRTQIGESMSLGNTINKGVDILGNEIIGTGTKFGSLGRSVSRNFPQGERVLTETISAGKAFSKTLLKTKKDTFVSGSKSLTAGDETLFAGRSISGKGLQTDIVGFIKKIPKRDESFFISPPKSNLKVLSSEKGLFSQSELETISQTQTDIAGGSIGNLFTETSVSPNIITKSVGVSSSLIPKTETKVPTYRVLIPQSNVLSPQRTKDTSRDISQLGSGLGSALNSEQVLKISPILRSRSRTSIRQEEPFIQTPRQPIIPKIIPRITPTTNQTTREIFPPTINIIPSIPRTPAPIFPQNFLSLSSRPGRASPIFGGFTPRYSPSLTSRTFRLFGKPSKSALTGNVTPFEIRYLLKGKRKRNSLGL